MENAVAKPRFWQISVHKMNHRISNESNTFSCESLKCTYKHVFTQSKIFSLFAFAYCICLHRISVILFARCAHSGKIINFPDFHVDSNLCCISDTLALHCALYTYCQPIHVTQFKVYYCIFIDES